MNKIRFTLLLCLLLPWTHVCAQIKNTSELDTMVIQSGGRQKPFYVFSHETLQSLCGKTSFQPDFAEEKWTAQQVIVSFWFSPRKWQDQEIILIEYEPLRKLLGIEGKKKTATYQRIAEHPLFLRQFEEVQNFKRMNQNAKLDAMQREVDAVAARLQIFQGLFTGDAFRVIAPPEGTGIQFFPVQLLPGLYSSQKTIPLMASFTQMRQAYEQGKEEVFGDESAQFVAGLKTLNPAVISPAWMIWTEFFYKVFHPFRWSWILFLGAFISLLAVPNKPLGYKVAWVLTIAGFVLQVGGFIMRVLISQRAPVTNMYETVIWLAFGVTLFAMILEWRHKCRYYLLSALPVAILSLLLADSLPTTLDRSIHPLMPVLQHNFWLTVHVLTITSSYAAFALALGVAHIILGKVILSKGAKIESSLYNYLYKTLQIGVLLLAIGTVLGAVWANYSWGRFWDWDPKETWALVAFLSYLFILHGRIAGWWGGFGLAVGSMIGFMTILMAWYGVNFVLGVGLHSYGFGSGGFQYAAIFVAFELAFTAVAVWFHFHSQKKPVVTTGHENG